MGSHLLYQFQNMEGGWGKVPAYLLENFPAGSDIGLSKVSAMNLGSPTYLTLCKNP